MLSQVSRDLTRWRADVAANGRAVILHEAAALSGLADLLDDRFADAVSMIRAARGRIVVSGIGKSGHVAGKIAATLASTGSPAQFVHPAEAAHGDLGMIVAGDVLILLSNSGATRELLPLAHHARALRIPVIAIGTRPASVLMTFADIALPLPTVDEAGPGQLAPTASSAMMMAMGDALAMAAMEDRGWSRSGFGALHPGGELGSRLGRVTVVMHAGAKMPLVLADTPMRDVIVTMTAFSFGIAGVIDGDRCLLGVITDGDLRRHVDTLFDSTARDVMTRNPVTIAASSLAEEALGLMNAHNVTALFVTEDGRDDFPVGLVHIHDFLRHGIG